MTAEQLDEMLEAIKHVRSLGTKHYYFTDNPNEIVEDDENSEE